MNRKYIIGGIAILAVALGVFFILQITSDNANDANSVPGANAQNGPLLAGIPTENQPFKATIKTSGVQGAELDGTFEYDGKGTGRFSGEQDGEKSEFYFTEDEFIICQNDSCFSLNGGQSNPIDRDSFNFSQSDFDTYKNTAVYEGEKDCPAGKCDVWSYSDGDGNASNVFIGTADQRVSQVTTKDSEGLESSVVYEYVDVTVKLPKVVEQLPGGI